MGFLDEFNLDDADYNFGNFGNDNPFDVNPFPMEDFRTAQIPQMLNPPQQQNTISGVMNEIGSGISQNPTLDRYFSLAQQGPPRREDYEAGTGRKILAAIGGIGSLFSDPKNAAQNTANILDRPYDLAMGSYAKDLAVAGDAAKQEAGLMNTGTSIFGHISQAENYRNMAENRGNRLNFDYTKLGQTGNIADRKLQIQQQQADDLAKYHAGQLSIGQFNANTNARRVAVQELESSSLIEGRKSNMELDQARIDALNRGPISGSRSTGPNAALMNRQVTSAIMSDPTLIQPKFWDSQGNLNMQAIALDPEAKIALARIQQHYGMIQPPEPFQLSNTFDPFRGEP